MKKSEIVILDGGIKESDDTPACWYCTAWFW